MTIDVLQGSCIGEGMKLAITSDIGLEGPETSGYITWLDVAVGDGTATYARARVALVHVGEIADAAGDIWPALHHTPLEKVHDVYFEQGWYNDDYADGAGIDLLYVESVTVDEAYRGKNLDLAIVRRLCDTLGSGCQLVVMPYTNALMAMHWAPLGFTISTPGRMAGLMHMKLGYRHARVVDENGTGDFEVLPVHEATLAVARSAVN
jgi:GNAT superfamily N-acetyltransferase